MISTYLLPKGYLTLFYELEVGMEVICHLHTYKQCVQKAFIMMLVPEATSDPSL